MSTFKQHLLEGGNAIDGVSRINQLNFDETVKKIHSTILSKLGISDDFVILGSGGKKDPKKNGEEDGSSGDIDIAIYLPELNREEIINQIISLCTEMGIKSRNLAGLGIASMSYPIENIDEKQSGQFVQVDIVPVDSLKFAEWAYYSPAYDESPYKGLYRNEALFFIARYAKYNVTKEIDGTPTEWERVFFDLSKGLMSGTQTNIGKKGKIIKTVTTIEKKIVSDDPDEIVSQLLGDGIKAEDVKTWEQVWDAMNSESFPFSDKKDNIFKGIANGLKKKEVEIPEVLKQYV